MPGQLIGRTRCACPLVAAALPADQLQAQLLHRHGCSSPHARPADRTRTVRLPPGGCCAACRSAAGAALTPARLQPSCLASRSDAHGAPALDGGCAACRSAAGATLTPARLQQPSCLASRSDAHGAPALCWLLRCLKINCRRSSYTGTAAAALMPDQQIRRAQCACPLVAAALPADQSQAQLLHRHGRSSPHAGPADRTHTVRPPSDGRCAACRSAAGVMQKPLQLRALAAHGTQRQRLQPCNVLQRYA